MSNITAVTYLVSRIYTNFRTFLCKKCDVGYYCVYQSRKEIDDYQLVFIYSFNFIISTQNC